MINSYKWRHHKLKSTDRLLSFPNEENVYSLLLFMLVVEFSRQFDCFTIQNTRKPGKVLFIFDSVTRFRIM